VVIPIMGISCDVTAATLPVEDRPPAGAGADQARKDCEAEGKYPPGASTTSPTVLDTQLIDVSVSGLLWWSASNWRNRITVPLTFGPPANTCDLVDRRIPLNVYGSEPAARATAQWAAAFCQDPTKFKLQHVRTGEPQAKSALANGSIPAALVSRPPPGGYAVPTVNAPIAVTGFAISYSVDGPNGDQYPDLKLTPRLIAKLLTGSYWSIEQQKNALSALPADDPRRAVLKNPRDMSFDPEFMALNPGIPTAQQVQSAASLLAISGNADTMYALTAYLNADPEARAFLDGQPDPWGMVVHPRYRGIALPRESWPLLDDLRLPLVFPDNSVCLYTGSDTVQNIPIMPLIAAPVASLAVAGLTMQYAVSNSSATNCVRPPTPPVNDKQHEYGGTFKPLGRESPGSRFVLGLTSLGDVGYLGLAPALLQSDASDVGAKFANGNNRHFVAPNNQSIAKAMSLATGDATTHTWPIPYDRLRTAAGAGAYPGTMVVYAAVPTTGLDPAVALQLGKLLRFAAGPGQQQGFDPGQVPPGFLPMTAANGLGGLVAYTLQAADLVEAQARGNQTTPPPPNGGPGGVPNPGAALPSASGPASLAPFKPQVESVSYTAARVSALAGWAMPVVVLVGLLAIAVAVLTPTGTVLRMSSSIKARLALLAELRSRS
jgi:ABC-type phosphate transport system substrate-binding protein